MKLLVLTQRVDRGDAVLGFFHRWLERLSPHFDSILVICLGIGECRLPENVKVISLSKEQIVARKPTLVCRPARIRHVVNFYKNIWKERKNYDAVFVHMNQEYILLGGLFWKIFGKRIYLWRNHKEGSWLTRAAVMFSDKVFYTSSGSFTARFKKSIKMPAGIDTDFFKPDLNKFKTENSLLVVGRLDPVKNVDILIKALTNLHLAGTNNFRLTVVGEATDRHLAYEAELRTLAQPLRDAGLVNFVGSKTGAELVGVYQTHQYYINLTDSGSFDKTILEAMACGCLIIASNCSIADVLPPDFLFREKDLVGLTDILKNILADRLTTVQVLPLHYRNYVVEKHNLGFLSEKIKEVLMDKIL